MIFRSRKRRAVNNKTTGEDTTSDDTAKDSTAKDSTAKDDAAAEPGDDPQVDDSQSDDSQAADSTGAAPGQRPSADDGRSVNHPGEDADRAAAVPADEADAGSDPDTAPNTGSVADEDPTEDDLGADEMERLDAQDWRRRGPYDIGEADSDSLEADDETIDLGSIVLPAIEAAEIRLQVDEDSQQVVSVMLVIGESALEIAGFAAPRSGGLWPEIRPELVSTVTESGGSADLVSGPFGVELRRLLPVQTPDGDQGYQPSRMWVAEGPRWMLRGIVYGDAALTEGSESPVAELVDIFTQIVVRRGDEAMVPGDLLPFNLPPELADEGDEDGMDRSDDRRGGDTSGAAE